MAEATPAATAAPTGTAQPGMTTVYPWWLLLIQGLAAFILGIFFLAFPFRTLEIAVTFLGAYWFISGIIGLVSLISDRSNLGWKLFTGILGIIAGIVILIYPLYSTILLPALVILFIAVWGLIMGATHLAASFSTKDWAMGILGVIAIIFGLLILAEPLISTMMLPYTLGLIGIFGGVIAMIFAFKVKGAQA